MDTISIITLSTIFATSAMTLFSYIISKVFNKNYVEPFLLAKVLMKFKLISIKPLLWSWVMHYLIGLFFILIYQYLWDSNLLQITILNGVLLGAISGIIGAAGWKNFLHFANMKIKEYDTMYYVQLVLAHVVFGVVVAITYLH